MQKTHARTRLNYLMHREIQAVHHPVNRPGAFSAQFKKSRDRKVPVNLLINCLTHTQKLTIQSSSLQLDLTPKMVYPPQQYPDDHYAR